MLSADKKQNYFDEISIASQSRYRWQSQQIDVVIRTLSDLRMRGGVFVSTKIIWIMVKGPWVNPNKP